MDADDSDDAVATTNPADQPDPFDGDGGNDDGDDDGEFG